MKVDFRQRLLTTTLFVGAGMLATPAFAQATPPECPPGTVPGNSGACNPADTSQGTGTQPETVGPPAGTVTPPSTNAQGAQTGTAGGEIIVTGTRIPQPNLETASPVTTVSSQEVKLSGTTRTEDLVNSLPQVFAAQGSNISNGASGTATVDLRGLGSKRNLVLVNGRRLQPGDTGNPVADINFVPNQLIKRVDVLTGGASSVYGADAVAGVINFIMDTTFTGFRIDGQASVFQHNNHTDENVLHANALRGFLPPKGNVVNGGAQDVAAMFGAAFDDGRGHVTAYATYRSQDPVLESTRDFSNCTLSARADGTWRCGGSGTTSPTAFFTNVGTFQVNGTGLGPLTKRFNFAPYNYFQRPDERYTFGGFADYEIAPGAHPYVEAMFMDDHTDAQIAPSGIFVGNVGTVNCDNPLMSASQRATLCQDGNLVGQEAILDANGNTTGFTAPTLFPNGTGGTFTKAVAYVGRRNVEGGGRDDDVRHDDFRVVAGMRGDPIPGISYDAYYQTGHTLRQETYFNDFSVNRINFALDAVAVDANGNVVAPGTPGSTVVCRATLQGIATANGCVPYNIFQAGGVTQAQLDYLQTPGFQRGSITENIAHVDVTVVGDEFGLKSPWADTGVGANFGLEYRKEALDFKVDQEFSTGDLAGQGGPTPPVSGHFDVREAFGEVQVPIIEHSFIDELSVDGAYRTSNYHVAANSFNTSTYKLEARFAPIKDVRFRASYNRAVRAPNIVELFFPQSLGLSGTADPCANQNDTGVPSATLAQCQFTGVTAAQYGHILANPANQYQGLFGGNPDLKPETADTWTYGVILQPRFIPGLAVTVDYFNIHLRDEIGSFSFDQVMSGCLAGNQLYCPLIHRNANGSLWIGPNAYINLQNLNQPGLGLYTKGFDINGSYSHRLGGLGTLNLALVGTLLKKAQDQNVLDADNNIIDCVGKFAGPCGAPTPKWRHVARATLTMPNGIGASLRWRYFSAVDAVDAPGNVFFGGPTDKHFTARSYFDLSFTARMQQRLNLRLGVNNILDKDPPLAGDFVSQVTGNGNTYPQVYDALGRYFFAGFTVDF
jgi:outer membrane receptor protein involved in Fe transport